MDSTSSCEVLQQLQRCRLFEVQPERAPAEAAVELWPELVAEEEELAVAVVAELLAAAAQV